jgi:hypothetical protein
LAAHTVQLGLQSDGLAALLLQILLDLDPLFLGVTQSRDMLLLNPQNLAPVLFVHLFQALALGHFGLTKTLLGFGQLAPRLFANFLLLALGLPSLLSPGALQGLVAGFQILKSLMFLLSRFSQTVQTLLPSAAFFLQAGDLLLQQLMQLHPLALLA